MSHETSGEKTILRVKSCGSVLIKKKGSHYMNKTVVLSAAAMVLSSVSCAQAPGDEGFGAESLQPDDHLRTQGIAPQGHSYNGFSTQGFSTQGFSTQGFSTQGGELKGFGFASFENKDGPIGSVALNGTIFQGVDGTGAAITGAGFIGATLTAVRGDNTLTPIRIDDVQPSSDPEITLYTLAWYNGTGWVNPCGEQNGLPIRAVPTKGRWKYAAGVPDGGDYINDPHLFTFSCTTGVISKCMFFGYKPWRTVEECNGSTCQTLPLQPFHQACIRMMRNDRCGNGNSHTVNGTTINLYDARGIQLDESTTMPLEAEWTPEGASCVKHHRWTTGGEEVVYDAQQDTDANCSHIDDWNAQAACGTPSSTFNTAIGFSTPLAQRALLRNDSQAPPNSGWNGDH
jgi:hypothetical protein